MARELHRLKAGQIDKLPIGKHHDGGGLYLHVTASGRYWFFRWGRGGRGMQSLGPTHTVSLADARAKAAAARKLLVDGRDPKVEREAVRSAARAQAARASDVRCGASRPLKRTGPRHHHGHAPAIPWPIRLSRPRRPDRQNPRCNASCLISLATARLSTACAAHSVIGLPK
jgi:hypothetical protein